MPRSSLLFGGLLISAIATPALAADGPVVITQANALAGEVTPGDRPGFPVTITQPGSYELGSNLQVRAGKRGIVVTTWNVTIDLKGFTLDGQKEAIYGIYVPDYALNLAVRNGTIFDFEKNGLHAPDVHLASVEDLRIYSNDGDGVALGSYSRIADSILSANRGRGILCGFYCQIQGNVVAGNNVGIALTEGNILGNTIEYNTGLGILANYAGIGNNTLIGNNGIDGAQATGVFPMQPNVCIPECEYASEPMAGQGGPAAIRSSRPQIR